MCIHFENFRNFSFTLALSLLAGCKMASSPSSDGPSSDGPSSDGPSSDGPSSEPVADISGNKYWTSIAMSSNGKYLAAVVGGSSGDGRHIYTSSNSGKTWTDRSTPTGSEIAGNKSWFSIAMSEDGQKLAQKLAAVAFGGHIYTSLNSGATWTDRSTAAGSVIGGNKNWTSIAVSDNGKKLAAVVGGRLGGHLYTSSNYGATWTNRSTAADSVSVIGGIKNWTSIAMSDDGEKLAAVAWGGHIYTSSNSGANWTDRSTGAIAGNKNWYSIAMSPDGQYLAAVAYNGHIYTYSDSEATWTDRSTAAGSVIGGNKNWTSIAMSDDGQYLAAVVYRDHLYTSSNYGATWTNRSTAAGSVSVIGGTKSWFSIAMSDDGEKLAAVVRGGHLYTAMKSGTTWTWTDRSTQEAP